MTTQAPLTVCRDSGPLPRAVGEELAVEGPKLEHRPRRAGQSVALLAVVLARSGWHADLADRGETVIREAEGSLVNKSRRPLTFPGAAI